MKNLEKNHNFLDEPEVTGVENIDVEKNKEDDPVSIELESIEPEIEVINNETRVIKGEKDSCDKLQTAAVYLDDASLETKEADYSYIEVTNNSKLQMQEFNDGQLIIRMTGEAYINNIKDSNIAIEGKLVVSGDFIDSKLKIKDGASADIGNLEDTFVTIGRNAKVVIGSCKNVKIKISTGATVVIRDSKDSFLNVEAGATLNIENKNDSYITSTSAREIVIDNPLQEEIPLSDDQIQKSLEAWQKIMAEAKQASDELIAEYEQKNQN